MSGIIGGVGSKSGVIGQTGDLTLTGWLNQNSTDFSMKVLTGTTDTSDSFTVAHGLTDSKILFVNVIINPFEGDYFMASYHPAGTTYSFNYYVEGANVKFVAVGANLQGDPYTILIIYTS